MSSYNSEINKRTQPEVEQSVPHAEKKKEDAEENRPATPKQDTVDISMQTKKTISLADGLPSIAQTAHGFLHNIYFSSDEIKPRIKASYIPHKVFKQTLKYRVIKLINKLKQLGILPGEIAANNLYSQKPIQRETTKEFMHAVKCNDLICEYIMADKHIVYEFDYPGNLPHICKF